MILRAQAQPNQIIMFEDSLHISGSTLISSYLDGSLLEWDVVEYRLLEFEGVSVSRSKNTYYFTKLLQEEAVVKIRVTYGLYYFDVVINLFLIKSAEKQWQEIDGALFTDKKVGIGVPPELSKFRVKGEAEFVDRVIVKDLKINSGFKVYNKKGYLKAVNGIVQYVDKEFTTIDTGTEGQVVFRGIDNNLIGSDDFKWNNANKILDITARVNITGNIYQNGVNYKTYAQELYTTNDFIVTRSEAGAGQSIATGNLSGIQVTRYNGTDNLVFGTDKSGFFKVGKVGALQILGTREDTPTVKGIPYYDDTSYMWKTHANMVFDIVQNRLTLANLKVGTGTGFLYATAGVVGVSVPAYYTDAKARKAISLTTIGTTGVATYDDLTGKWNIPNYTKTAADFDIKDLADITDLRTFWTNKQEKLVSGTNIKTINGTTILGSGNIVTPNDVYTLTKTKVEAVLTGIITTHTHNYITSDLRWDGGSGSHFNATTGRSSLGLGTAATKNVGTSSGNAMEVGAFGWGGYGEIISDVNDMRNSTSRFWRVLGGALNTPTDGNYWGGIHFQWGETTSLHKQGWDLAVNPILGNNAPPEFWVRSSGNSGDYSSWGKLYHSTNLLDIGTSASSARSAIGLIGNSNTTHYHDGRYFTEDEVTNKLATKVNKAGDTMTGALIVKGSHSGSASPTLGGADAYNSLITWSSAAFGLGIHINSSGRTYIQNQRFDGATDKYDICLQPLGGNVAIGKTTVTTGYMLDVNGAIISSGNIRGASYLVGATTVIDTSRNATFANLTATGTTTLASTLSGLLKAASGVVSAATAGTDYQAPLTNPITGTGTANQIAYFTGTTSLASLSTATYPSLTELSYVKGVTSALQTQLNAKISTTLASTSILVGSSTNVATARVLSLSATAGTFGLGNTGILTIPNANTSTRGLLTSTDWNTFNGKQATLVSGTNIKTVNSTTLLGLGNLSVGTVTSVAALTLGTTGTDVSSSVANGTTTPVITLNIPTASAANRGALSSADWTTFNNKQNTLVSGTTIKTVNGSSILGSGNIDINSEDLRWDGGSTGLDATTGRASLGLTGVVGTHTHTYSHINFNTAANISGSENNANLWNDGVSLTVVSGNNTTYPTGYGTLATFKFDGTRTLQLYGSYLGGRLFVRTPNGTNVENWHEVYTTGNLTNPIQGTGSANYIPKFINGSTLDKSLIYEVNNGIAIGKMAVTSGYILDVNGAIIVTGGNSTNWNTAYTDRLKWNGGSTGLNAATGRASLGLGTAATKNVGTSTGQLPEIPSQIEMSPLTNVLAKYSSSNSSSRRLMIKLPFNANSTKMLNFTIDVYSSYSFQQYICSGYLYGTPNNWYAAKAHYIGELTSSIIFGRDTDNRAYVSINISAYAGVTVRDANFGFNAIESDRFNKGWSIVETESTPNTATHSINSIWHSANLANPIQGTGSAGKVAWWKSATELDWTSKLTYDFTNSLLQHQGHTTLMGSYSLPVTGGTDINGSLRIGGVGTSVSMDIGVSSNPGAYGPWLQGRNTGDQSYYYPIFLNPNGGGVAIGKMAVTSGYTLDVNGATQTTGLKIGTLSGLLKASSGVVGTATAGTDYVAPNAAITGATKTKITYDSHGLITSGVDAVTDDIQESANPTNKYFTNARAQAAITGGASTITTANLTASRALVSNASGKVAVSAVTSTELGYLDGVSSAIQDQINGKQASGSYEIIANKKTTLTDNDTDYPTTKAVKTAVDGKMANPMTTAGDIIYGGASGAATRLAKGTDGKVLKLVSGNPAWADDNDTKYSGTAGVTLNGLAFKHSIGSPYNHIPTGGEAGNFLGYDTSGTAKWATPPNDNNKVTQTVTTTSEEYPVLLKNTTAVVDVTDTTRFATLITANPNTGKITAKALKATNTLEIGNLNGNLIATNGEVKVGISNDTFNVLTSNVNGAWDCTTGLNKTWSINASKTLTISNLVSGMFGALHITISVYTGVDITLSTGSTNAGNGRLSNLDFGKYMFCFSYNGSTFEWNLARYD